MTTIIVAMSARINLVYASPFSVEIVENRFPGWQGNETNYYNKLLVIIIITEIITVTIIKELKEISTLAAYFALLQYKNRIIKCHYKFTTTLYIYIYILLSTLTDWVESLSEKFTACI